MKSDLITQSMIRMYILKTWVFTMLSGSYVLALFSSVLVTDTAGQPDEVLLLGVLVAAYSLIFSLPTILICFFALLGIVQKIKSILKIKLIILSVALAFAFLTMLVLLGSDSATLYFTLVYGVCMIVFGCIFSISKGIDKPVSAEQPAGTISDRQSQIHGY